MEDKQDNRQLAYWLALLRTPSLGDRLAHKLIEHTGSVEAIFHLSVESLTACGLKPKAIQSIQVPDRDRIKADLSWLKHPDKHLITFDDPAYPSLLKQISDPPLALFVQGKPELLNNLQIAVVGSRRPSPDGCRLAGEFGLQLADSGITVTSGLAKGIDTCAHRQTMAIPGRSVAVLGSGLDRIYPASNKMLAESIAASGALVSEYPLGYRPMPGNFPARNRIISGLSLGVLVVEAAAKSGSLITARHALGQGREVFAIPGSVRNPMAQGCHALIRDGAKLVETINDIFEEVGALAHFVQESAIKSNNQPDLTKGLDAEAKLLLDNIGYQPVSVDELVEVTSLPVNILLTELLKLEMANLIESGPGGHYIRR